MSADADCGACSSWRTLPRSAPPSSARRSPSEASPRPACRCLILSIPLWVLLAYLHRLYHLDSYRADYRAADELGPVLQMATVWSWMTLLALELVDANGVRCRADCAVLGADAAAPDIVSLDCTRASRATGRGTCRTPSWWALPIKRRSSCARSIDIPNGGSGRRRTSTFRWTRRDLDGDAYPLDVAVDADGRRPADHARPVSSGSIG